MTITKKRKILLLGGCGSFGIKIFEKFINNEPNSFYYINIRDKSIKKKIYNNYKFKKIKFLSMDLSKKLNKNYVKILKRIKIDVFINASGSVNRQTFFKESDSNWNKIMMTNLNNPKKIIHFILPSMIKNKYGKIINFTSQVIRKTHPAAAPSYEISKAGLLSLNRYLAKNFAQFNINFNTIMPGTIKSKMQKNIIKKDFDKIKREIPQKRIGTTNEVAELVFFLCSERASYINGANINISGASLLD